VAAQGEPSGRVVVYDLFALKRATQSKNASSMGASRRSFGTRFSRDIQRRLIRQLKSASALPKREPPEADLTESRFGLPPPKSPPS
jgi:hypothetical protein